MHNPTPTPPREIIAEAVQPLDKFDETLREGLVRVSKAFSLTASQRI